MVDYVFCTKIIAKLAGKHYLKIRGRNLEVNNIDFEGKRQIIQIQRQKLGEIPNILAFVVVSYKRISCSYKQKM